MVRMKFRRRAAIAALLVGFGALAGTCLPALKRPAPNDDPNPTTTATLKQLVSGLLKGEYEPASFTPAMGIFLSTATGKAFMEMVRRSRRAGQLGFL